MRVGYISYSNSYAFVREAKDQPIEGVEIYEAPPAELNEKMSRSELDLSAISTFEFLKHHKQYLILPDLSIHSKGFVKSVILYSKRPFSELKNGSISITPESATSVNLLRILIHMNGLEGLRLEISSAKNKEQNPEAKLLIGDGALQFDSSDYPHSIDLAEEWLKQTGLPVVFALWVIKKNLAAKDYPTVEKVRKQLIKSRQLISSAEGSLLKDLEKKYGALDSGWADYLSGLDFHLGVEQIRSVQTYAQELFDLGILKEVPTLNFYSNIEID